MKDIVGRLRDINEDSLVMAVVSDCLDAAEEIELLREECAFHKQAITEIKASLIKKKKLAEKAGKSKKPSA